jgi:hypothetical protein
VATAALSISAQAESIVYDNTSNPLGQYWNSGTEFGDQVTLGGLKGDRIVKQFKMEYYMSYGVSGDETAQIKFYSNSGANGAPSSLLYDTGVFSLTRAGYNTVTINDVNVAIPDNFTWTVSFGGLTGSEVAGVTLYNPPTVGSSFNDFWEKTSSGWTLKQMPGGTPVANFAAQITAVPEPTTIQLALMAGLAGLGMISRRRR